MLPGNVVAGGRVLRSTSIKMKSSGGAAQISGVLAPGVLLTLTMFRWYKVPEPDRGVKSCEKADTRRVLMEPVPKSTFPDTFQLLPVSPAPETGGSWKVTTVELKVKSPWNPTRLSAALICEVATGSVKLVTDVSTSATGREISTETGVGVGVGV